MKRNIYYTCPRCGANLDPGERCDCRQQDYKKEIIEMIQNNSDSKWLPVIHTYAKTLLEDKEVHKKKKDRLQTV